MLISVDEERAEAKSRLVGLRLSMLTLRMMENWARHVRDYDSAMIMLAVAAITGEKFTRTHLEDDLQDLRRSMPAERLTHCNISSIAEATGLNRETTRRRVNKLVDKGILVRWDDGSVAFNRGLTKNHRTIELVHMQLETLCRTVNDLARDGSLKIVR